ncbi:metallophosphoesterase [Xanthomonas cassavae CFBP 4642]|uniref:Metallophosphoesterase n=1 Tax=Xanthomonas cassavae CFBP 4642 TaxID=1219375 RepID=A0ABS8HHN5_9XANT|nr:metallophosphoesterase [Xanthomonas cassavae]MCC4621693.1 metallophosphoesterase [Xanthomonas cassavae CFBP 4642]
MIDYKYLAVPFLLLSASCYAQSLSVNRNIDSLQAKSAGGLNAFDDRSTDVNIVNNIVAPMSDLIFVDKGINSGWDSGIWKSTPPMTILFPYGTGKMGTTSNAWLHGAGGWVKYKVKNDGTILTFSWVNPYKGSNGYHTSESNDGLYSITRNGGSGNNASVTFSVKRNAVPRLLNYSAVIMSDPQPWRLGGPGDPNSDSQNGSSWRDINHKTFNSILSLPNVEFAIVNGDLTEYGRKKQYDDYSTIYHSSSIFITEGLGNHDYANNVGSCMALGYGVSENGCALSAVEREYDAIQNIKNNIAEMHGSAFSADVSETTAVVGEMVEQTYKGSLAYSWDVGNIHYIQLQNFPTYAVNMSSPGHADAEIRSSLEWLSTDLERADLRGKATVINFHDARPASDDGDSAFLKSDNRAALSKFKSMITSHNVKAIFVGHTHQQNYCRANDDAVFGSIPVYTSGALFNGDYYVIDVKGGSINVKAYNGASGRPVVVKDLGIVGSAAPQWPTCSNL